MKYYVIYVANGNLQLDKITEWTSKESAIGKFHDVCSLMWKDSSVTDASVAILDNQLNIIEPYREGIHKA